MAIGGLLAIAAAGLLGAVRGDISQANAALALVLIVGTLTLKPNGLFGKHVVTRV